MMLYDKKFYKYIGCCAVYFVFTICYLFFSNATTVWQASWFSDKFFVYQYAIVLLLGYSIISSYYNSQTYNRFETRKRIVTNQLFLYALLNLILVTMLFVLAMAVTMILGGAKSFFTLQTLLDLYFRFLLGSYLLETIDLIFEYRRIDNLDIASVTLPVIGELPEARFVSTQITDDFMYIKVVNPRLQADVVPGDVVQAGVIISNSETGLGSVTIQPLIYRLVCSNGMVINDAKTRRNHVGRAATSDEDFSIYSNETLLADDHAFVLKIKDTVRAAISEARFAQVVSRMRESTEALLDTKQLPAIVKLASSSFGITEDESNGVLEHLITGGDFSLYGLANAVTRFSQDVESYDRATKLEEIGYSVMTMSPALFRQMNRTELLAA